VVDLADLLNAMGARIEGAGEETIRIDGVDQLGGAEHEIIGDRIEGGTYLVGAAMTGGDVTLTGAAPADLGQLLETLAAIGVRPIDQHLKGLAKLGAEIAIENGYVVARAKRLRGARITTDLVTVTGTENLMMAAALADGTTVIENAAREPEVADLAALLTAMGAKLDGVGSGHIEIQGVPALGGATHRVVADRVEAGTLIVAGALTHGDVTVTDLVPEHIEAVLAKLEECGVSLDVGPTSVRVRAPERPRAADVTTSPFPGFPTDMQAQLMTLLGLADGQSRVTETIFENRFMHAAELARMGAHIETDGSIAVIRGVREYQGAPVMASDLRASAALVLAGLAARGRTEVARIYHLDRGYERLEKKLAALGARIERRA